MTMELPGTEVQLSTTPTPEPKPESAKTETPAQVEEKAPETSPAAIPPPEFWNQLPKEVQESLVKEKVTGENLTKHVLKLYDKLARERQALENERKALGQPKPTETVPGTRQAQELKVLKQALAEMAQKDPAKWEEYESLYKAVSDRASAINEDDQPITRAEIKRLMQEEWEAKEMNAAAAQLVQTSKGRLDPDKAYGIVNGLTANGMSVEDAVQTITEILGSVEKSAASEAVKTVTQPKPTTPIVAPGTTSAPPAQNKELTDDELAQKVLKMALKDADKGA